MAFDPISAVGTVLDFFGGNKSQDSANEANQAALAAQQQAQQQQLDYQKVLTYLQMMQGNQTSAQQLAAALSGQQQAANQYTQLYNQDITNRLPQQQLALAGMQAMTPLMQMAGMTGYQMPTQIDTTKLTAPDVVGDFNKLSQYYQQQGQMGGVDAATLLQALNDPATFLKNASAGTTATPATVGTPTSPAATSTPGFVSTGSVGAVGKSDFPSYLKQAQANAALQGKSVSTTDVWKQWTTGQSLPILTKGTAAPVATPTAGTTTAANTGTSLEDIIKSLSTTKATQAPPTYTQLQAAPLSAAAQVTETPAYKWEQEQMNKAMMNQLAAQGLTGSGAATKMASDAAMQLSQSEFDRQQKRLQDLVAIGQGYQPTSGAATAGTTLANIYNRGASNTGEALQDAANARTSAYSGLGSAYGSAAQNNANALSQYYGNSANIANTGTNKWAGLLGGLSNAGVFGSGYQFPSNSGAGNSMFKNLGTNTVR